ncbi:hypothetical protein Hanom_Chr09g00837561 [Helianthus anomalus]
MHDRFCTLDKARQVFDAMPKRGTFNFTHANKITCNVKTWEFSGRVKGIKMDIVDTTSAQESGCFSSWSIIKTVMH